MAAGILFDLDETLLDRHGNLLRCASDLYRAFAHEAKIRESEFVSLVDRLDGRGRAPRDEFFAGLARRAFSSVTPDRLREYFYANGWLNPKPFPGVAESLMELRERRLPVGVVTNGSKKSQGAKLRNSGLSGLVDAVVISGEFGFRKPDERIFLHICHRLSIEPKESWFFGDDPVADIGGASRLGMRTVWLERFLPWPEDMGRCYHKKADQVQDTIEFLPTGP